MPIIDLSDYDLPSAEEPKIVEDGTYNVRIIDISFSVNANNNLASYGVRLELIDDPLSKDLFEFINLPNKVLDNAKRYASKVWTLKCFLNCFKVSLSGMVDIENDMLGLEGRAVIGKRNTDKFGMVNYVREWLTS